MCNGKIDFGLLFDQGSLRGHRTSEKGRLIADYSPSSRECWTLIRLLGVMSATLSFAAKSLSEPKQQTDATLLSCRFKADFDATKGAPSDRKDFLTIDLNYSID
jgi:hypothetical protein